MFWFLFPGSCSNPSANLERRMDGIPRPQGQRGAAGPPGGMDLGTPRSGRTRSRGHPEPGVEPGTPRIWGATRARLHEGSLQEGCLDPQHPQAEQLLPTRPWRAVRGTAAAPVPRAPAQRGPLGVQEPPGPPGAARAGRGQHRAGSPRLAPGSARPGEELVVDSRHSPAQMGLNYLKCFSRELALAV